MNTDNKRICVIGLGQFGRQLAISLAKRFDVLAVDHDRAVVDSIADEVQRSMAFDARDFESVCSAINDSFEEGIVSIGENIEGSTLCVLHLKKLGVKRIHAKAINNDHAEILRAVGADNILFPEVETARRLATQIVNPNLLDFLPLSEDFMVMQVSPPERFCGSSLMDLDIRRKHGVFVLAVKEHLSEQTRFMPPPEFVIKPSDSLVIIGREESLRSFREGSKESRRSFNES